MRSNLPCPRIEYWQESQTIYKYQVIGKNGRVVNKQEVVFSTAATLKDNIIALARVYHIAPYITGQTLFAGTNEGEGVPILKMDKPTVYEKLRTD